MENTELEIETLVTKIPPFNNLVQILDGVTKVTINE